MPAPGFIAKGAAVIGAWSVTKSHQPLTHHPIVHLIFVDTSPGHESPEAGSAPLRADSMNLRLPWNTMQTQVSIVANETINFVNCYPSKLYYDVV